MGIFCIFYNELKTLSWVGVFFPICANLTQFWSRGFRQRLKNFFKCKHLNQRERKNRKVSSVDMSELSISVQPIRRHNCEEWKCATNKNALRSQNCSWARPVRILLTYLTLRLWNVLLKISILLHKWVNQPFWLDSSVFTSHDCV